jgi:Tripartite tricarboxylate transporter TctB family
MGQHTESEGKRTGVATNIVEAVVAFIILIGGVTVVYQAMLLGHRWGSDGPGPGYFPFYIGLLVSIGSAVTLIQAFIGKHKNTDVFVDNEQLNRVLAVLIPAAVFVAAIHWLGIYISAALYIALFMIVLGKYNPVKSAIIAITTQVIFFFMFEVWFKVPLYKGSLDLMGFLGY